MNFFISTFDGLASLVAEQLPGCKLGAPLDVRHGQLIPVEASAPAPLLSASVAEDVFADLGALPLSGTSMDLRKLERHPLWGAALKQALGTWSEFTGKPLTKRLVFRVVVQADDATWRRYRREDMRLSAERALINTGSWRISRDEAPIEVWLFQTGRSVKAALRLTTNQHRQRGGRAVEREAALRPSVAAAMVWLSRPTDADVVLDPMCGSGTLLLERALSGRYIELIGGDSDAGAVRAALANFGPRHQPRRFEHWDARELPLEDASVTTVLCNLPWGRKIGEQAELPALYRASLSEMVRVLQPGGRMVCLTSERKTFDAAVGQLAGIKLERSVNRIEVLGRRADIIVLIKK